MRSRSRSQQSGFTLIETMIALVIFAIVSAMMAPSFALHLKNNLDSQIRTGAYTAAQQVLDELRSVNPETLPTTGTSAAQTISAGTRSYSITTTYCTTSSYCSARSRHLTLNVSYKGNVIYTVSTVFTRLK